RGRFVQNAFVMVVHCHGQRLLGVFLADALAVKLAFVFRRVGNSGLWFLLFWFCLQFLVEYAFLKGYAGFSNLKARAGGQFFDFGMGFAAKTAQRDIGGPRHEANSFLFLIIPSCRSGWWLHPSARGFPCAIAPLRPRDRRSWPLPRT